MDNLVVFPQTRWITPNQELKTHREELIPHQPWKPPGRNVFHILGYTSAAGCLAFIHRTVPSWTFQPGSIT